MSNLLVVGVADCAVRGDPRVTLVTYALGSCIAVTIHDPAAQIGGLLHLMLPDSTDDPVRAQMNRSLYADTGVAALFRQAIDMGAEKRRLKVWVAGGAQILGGQSFFDVGKQNYLAVKKLLWQTGVLLEQSAVGGSCYRTVRLHLSDGKYQVQEGGRLPEPQSPPFRTWQVKK